MPPDHPPKESVESDVCRGANRKTLSEIFNVPFMFWACCPGGFVTWDDSTDPPIATCKTCGKTSAKANKGNDDDGT